MQNKFIGKGLVINQPRIDKTSKGTSVANAVASVRKTWTNKNGEIEYEDIILPLTVYGSLAKKFNQDVIKGDILIFDGSLSQKEEIDQETGYKRYETFVIIESFHIVCKGIDLQKA